MQELRELVVKAPDLVREKLLELLQTWAFAFRQTPKYRAVQVSQAVSTLRTGHLECERECSRSLITTLRQGLGKEAASDLAPKWQSRVFRENYAFLPDYFGNQ